MPRSINIRDVERQKIGFIWFTQPSQNSIHSEVVRSLPTLEQHIHKNINKVQIDELLFRQEYQLCHF